MTTDGVGILNESQVLKMTVPTIYLSVTKIDLDLEYLNSKISN